VLIHSRRQHSFEDAAQPGQVGVGGARFGGWRPASPGWPRCAGSGADARAPPRAPARPSEMARDRLQARALGAAARWAGAGAGRRAPGGAGPGNRATWSWTSVGVDAGGGQDRQRPAVDQLVDRSSPPRSGPGCPCSPGPRLGHPGPRLAPASAGGRPDPGPRGRRGSARPSSCQTSASAVGAPARRRPGRRAGLRKPGRGLGEHVLILSSLTIIDISNLSRLRPRPGPNPPILHGDGNAGIETHARPPSLSSAPVAGASAAARSPRSAAGLRSSLVAVRSSRIRWRCTGSCRQHIVGTLSPRTPICSGVQVS